jgi:uncharacterized membrane protein YgcG
MLRAIALCLVLSSLSVYAAFPTPRGYVNDFANVIDAQREAQIDALVRETARMTSAEIVVVTVPTLDGMTVEDYAAKLFASWGIGKKGKDNGVLVLVAPGARATRIEVGYGLEPVLPDGLAGEIIRTSFLPRFRDNDYSTGIADGVDRARRKARRAWRCLADQAVERCAARLAGRAVSLVVRRFRRPGDRSRPVRHRLLEDWCPEVAFRSAWQPRRHWSRLDRRLFIA